MYEKLKTKLEKAAEDYTDLLIKRVEAASKDLTSESFIKADEAVRMAVYITSAIERMDRIDRPNRSNETDGQNS